MNNKEEIKEKIKKVISEGSVENGKLLIEEFKKNFRNDDEVASMEAIINFYEEDYNRVLDNIREGLKYNIFNSDLYYTMGNVYEVKGDYNIAYLCYEQALYLCKEEENKEVIKSNIKNLKHDYKIEVNKVAIVILTYNQLKYTKACIDSIRKYNEKETYEIIVVDNNSTDDTVVWLKEQDDIKVVFNKENKGFPVGCNQGIEMAGKNRDIFLLNNDTIIMPNSIFNLRMGLYSNKNIGATGAVSNSVSYYQQVNEKYDSIKEYEEYALKNNITDENNYEERIKLIGFAMLIKRQALNKVGFLDEIFSPGNFEDDDISFRILEQGFKILLCRDSFILHFGSVSFGEKRAEYIKLLNENSNKFKEKWGFSIEHSTFIRDDIIALLNGDKNRTIRVLEIGCGCGATLLKIKNRYKNAELYGIELNEHSAKIAECFADISTENIENTKLSYGEGFFDYIIFADVLGHLYDPSLVLENMKKYLKKDGCIIASIPNVMHYSVIRELLSGSWTYRDSGILDKRHVRFFTLNEVVKLFDNIGYKIEHIGATNIGCTDEDEKFILNLAKLNGVAPKEQFEAYQYIVRVTKK